MNIIYDKGLQIWHGITFGTKFVIISSIICYILDLIMEDYLSELLICDPLEVIEHYQFWRVLVPQFFHLKFYNLAISLLGFSFSAVEFEKTYGTVPFFYDIFFKCLLISIMYVLMSFGLYLLYPPVLFNTFLCGFWCLTMVYMINKSLVNSDETYKIPFLRVYIHSKYYPVVFFVVMNILEFPRLDMCSAVVFAILEFQFFDGFLMKLSKNLVNRLEQSVIFRRYQSRQDFITCDQVNHSFIFKEFNVPQIEINTIATSTRDSALEQREQDQ